MYAVKQKNLAKDGINFLDQVRNMLKDFKIHSSEVKLNRNYTRSRDKNEMQELYFIIPSNYINLYNFIKKVGFLYNTKRKEHTLSSLPEIKRKAQWEIEKNSSKIKDRTIPYKELDLS